MVLAAVAAGIGGYRLGFITRATSWIGLALGLLIATRLLPPLAERFSGGDEVRLLIAMAGVLIGAAFLGQTLGLLAGSRLHLALPEHGPAQMIDRSTGAVAGVLGVAVALWLLLPVMADIPGWPARQARTSALAHAVDDMFPAAPDALQSLRQLVGRDRFPRVFGGLEAAPDLGQPPAQSGLSVGLADTVARSTVKVEAAACGRIQDGSGAVIGDELIVTNAHVVAGGRRITVERYPDGDDLTGQLVAFDPDRDLAVLRVPGLARPVLPMTDGSEGDRGAVFGRPGGGPLRLAPFEIGREVRANGNDIYDKERSQRRVLFISASLAPGDSGAALVNPEGEVIGVAFAIAPDQPNVAYALDISEVEKVLEGDLKGAVSSGPCI